MMKYLVVLAFLFVGPAQTAEKWVISVAESKVKWTAYTVLGNYQVSGFLDIKDSNLTIFDDQVEGDLTIDMTNISTNNSFVTEQIKGAEIFEEDVYPEAYFYISTSNLPFQIIGDLKIKDEEKQVKVSTTMTSESELVKSFTGKVTIDRQEFDLRVKGWGYLARMQEASVQDDFDIEWQIVFKPKAKKRPPLKDGL